MPYARRRSTRRITRRPRRVTRSRRYTRRVTRRTATRPTTRRRILQVSSKKKQDNRRTFQNVSAPGAPPVAGAAVLIGGTTYTFAYLATAIDKAQAGQAEELPDARTQTQVWMKGYKDNIAFTTNSGASWKWRRVCFTMKDSALISNSVSTNPLWLDTSSGFTRVLSPATTTQANTTTWRRVCFTMKDSALISNSVSTNPLWLDTSSGFTRVLSPATTTQANTTTSLIFKGKVGVDWDDPFIAKVDTTRVTIKYDHTSVLTSGNTSFKYFTRNMWHPMNSTFVYDDDEAGDGQSSVVWHSRGRQGMGDYYIIDFFECADTTTSNQLKVNMEGSLYFHER
ncbi:Cap [Molossus molossus associated gemykibivirus 2]|nr:Cap [Molossus molossus associated gemykibivirus 2]